MLKKILGVVWGIFALSGFNTGASLLAQGQLGGLVTLSLAALFAYMAYRCFRPKKRPSPRDAS